MRNASCNFLLSFSPPPRIRRLSVLAMFGLAAIQIETGLVAASDVTFNVTFRAESDPIPGSGSLYYGDVWAEGNYAYVGSDVDGGGISIWNISNPASPQFLTMYAGDQMEDVEVYNGIGYFGSDVSTTSGTGVDIVDLSNPANPVRLSRINGAIGGHNKVHTLSVNNGFLYTVDNAANQATPDYVKVWNVSDPVRPQFVTNIDLGLASTIGSHEVVAANGRLYVASKNNNNNSGDGWTHIFDISNVGTTGPVLLKAFETGGRTHTSMATPDGKTLIVAQERPDAEVRLYDISMINQPNDPDTPVLRKTLTRTSVGIDAHSPHHPMVVGDLLFMAWYEAGLQVFNIANPANPVHVGSFDTYVGTSTNYNGNWGVFPMLGLDKVLLSDRARGLIVVNASEVVATADFNSDGIVDGADFLTWQRGQGIASGATRAQGDGTRERAVNGLDLALWRTRFGGTGSGVGVPEGSTLGLLLVGLLFAPRRARRRPSLDRRPQPPQASQTAFEP